MCCTRFAENTGRKKLSKIRHLRTIAQLCRAVSSQLRRISTIGKKHFKQQYPSTCLHNMVDVSPLAAEIDSGVWGTPANFNGFRVFVALLHGTLVVGVSQTLRRYLYRARPIFGRAAITLFIGPHSSFILCLHDGNPTYDSTHSTSSSPMPSFQTCVLNSH